MDFGTLEFLKVVLVGVVFAAVLYWALNHALRGKSWSAKVRQSSESTGGDKLPNPDAKKSRSK